MKTEPDRFTCQRRTVAGHLFTKLFRYHSVRVLRFTIPRRELDSLGLREEYLQDDITEEDLSVVTDEYEGPVKLGNRLQVVWTTDFAEVEGSLDDPVALEKLLAIDLGRYVICVYNREDTGRSLHVPSTLDGIDNFKFKVDPDPDAPFGRTSPQLDSDTGLPEAVHRACQVVPQRWQLAREKS